MFSETLENLPLHRLHLKFIFVTTLIAPQNERTSGGSPSRLASLTASSKLSFVTVMNDHSSMEGIITDHIRVGAINQCLHRCHIDFIFSSLTNPGCACTSCVYLALDRKAWM